MALFLTPEEHAANPPSSWEVVKIVDRCWHLLVKDHIPGDGPLASCTTKREAEELRKSGYLVASYEKEGRWFAGETPTGHRPYTECAASMNDVAARREARRREAELLAASS